ncbi:MAG: alkaline phosphatase [Acidobacteria bacterium]|nr:alkaline phosphatase [Acidobacteriota bacterium]
MSLFRRRELLWVPLIARAQDRPRITHGIQIGDVTADGRATVWARGDRAADLIVSAGGRTYKSVMPATAATGFTARAELKGLAPDADVQFTARFGDGDTMAGRFRTAPRAPRDVRFLWSGDTCGQGYGINPDLGGMRIYETMRKLAPDFFLHSGDTIYADGPIPAEFKLPGGNLWRNVTSEAKSKVAETLDEFRGNYLYNLLDENVRRFNAEVSQVWQWDDHEVRNNWSPGSDLSGDARYTEKNIGTLVSRARQAFLEHAPMRTGTGIHRRISYGPMLDVFVIDMRSFRAANSANLQETQGPETVFLGAVQLRWLTRELARSRATWKVIASDMPIGLHVPDGKDAQGRAQWEAVANGEYGPARGRELEIAALLQTLKKRRVTGTVWLTADVHYTAAHYYDPAKAQFTDFDPFWEFVSGPLNAGTFGPGKMDATFGPQVIFQKAPPPGQSNLAPSAGLQFFGDVRISAKTRQLTVTLRDLTGAALFAKALPPPK